MNRNEKINEHGVPRGEVELSNGVTLTGARIQPDHFDYDVRVGTITTNSQTFVADDNRGAVIKTGSSNQQSRILEKNRNIENKNNSIQIKKTKILSDYPETSIKTKKINKESRENTDTDNNTKIYKSVPLECVANIHNAKFRFQRLLPNSLRDEEDSECSDEYIKGRELNTSDKKLKIRQINEDYIINNPETNIVSDESKDNILKLYHMMLEYAKTKGIKQSVIDNIQTTFMNKSGNELLTLIQEIQKRIAESSKIMNIGTLGGKVGAILALTWDVVLGISYATTMRWTELANHAPKLINSIIDVYHAFTNKKRDDNSTKSHVVMSEEEENVDSDIIAANIRYIAADTIVTVNNIIEYIDKTYMVINPSLIYAQPLPIEYYKFYLNDAVYKHIPREMNITQPQLSWDGSFLSIYTQEAVKLRGEKDSKRLWLEHRTQFGVPFYDNNRRWNPEIVEIENYIVDSWTNVLPYSTVMTDPEYEEELISYKAAMKNISIFSGMLDQIKDTRLIYDWVSMINRNRAKDSHLKFLLKAHLLNLNIKEAHAFSRKKIDKKASIMYTNEDGGLIGWYPNLPRRILEEGMSPYIPVLSMATLLEHSQCDLSDDIMRIFTSRKHRGALLNFPTIVLLTEWNDESVRTAFYVGSMDNDTVGRIIYYASHDYFDFRKRDDDTKYQVSVVGVASSTTSSFKFKNMMNSVTVNVTLQQSTRQIELHLVNNEYIYCSRERPTNELHSIMCDKCDKPILFHITDSKIIARPTYLMEKHWPQIFLDDTYLGRFVNNYVDLMNLYEQNRIAKSLAEFCYIMPDFKINLRIPEGLHVTDWLIGLSNEKMSGILEDMDYNMLQLQGMLYNRSIIGGALNYIVISCNQVIAQQTGGVLTNITQSLKVTLNSTSGLLNLIKICTGLDLLCYDPYVMTNQDCVNLFDLNFSSNNNANCDLISILRCLISIDQTSAQYAIKGFYNNVISKMLEQKGFNRASNLYDQDLIKALLEFRFNEIYYNNPLNITDMFDYSLRGDQKINGRRFELANNRNCDFSLSNERFPVNRGTLTWMNDLLNNLGRECHFEEIEEVIWKSGTPINYIRNLSEGQCLRPRGITLHRDNVSISIWDCGHRIWYIRNHEYIKAKIGLGKPHSNMVFTDGRQYYYNDFYGSMNVTRYSDYYYSVVGIEQPRRDNVIAIDSDPIPMTEDEFNAEKELSYQEAERRIAKGLYNILDIDRIMIPDRCYIFWRTQIDKPFKPYPYEEDKTFEYMTVSDQEYIEGYQRLVKLSIPGIPLCQKITHEKATKLDAKIPNTIMSMTNNLEIMQRMREDESIKFWRRNIPLDNDICKLNTVSCLDDRVALIQQMSENYLDKNIKWPNVKYNALYEDEAGKYEIVDIPTTNNNCVITAILDSLENEGHVDTERTTPEMVRLTFCKLYNYNPDKFSGIKFEDFHKISKLLGINISVVKKIKNRNVLKNVVYLGKKYPTARVAIVNTEHGLHCLPLRRSEYNNFDNYGIANDYKGHIASSCCIWETLGIDKNLHIRAQLIYPSVSHIYKFNCDEQLLFDLCPFVCQHRIKAVNLFLDRQQIQATFGLSVSLWIMLTKLSLEFVKKYNIIVDDILKYDIDMWSQIFKDIHNKVRTDFELELYDYLNGQYIDLLIGRLFSQKIDYKTHIEPRFVIFPDRKGFNGNTWSVDYADNFLNKKIHNLFFCMPKITLDELDRDKWFQTAYHWCAAGGAPNKFKMSKLKSARANKRSAMLHIKLSDIDNHLKRHPYQQAGVHAKPEMGKIRLIFDVDIYHYLICDYFSRIIETRLPQDHFDLYANKYKEYRNIREKVNACKKDVIISFDYKNFDTQHNTKYTDMIFDNLILWIKSSHRPIHTSKILEHVNWIKQSFHNQSLVFENKTYKIASGLFSGTRMTTIINSILNYAYINLVVQSMLNDSKRMNVKQLYCHGDDVWLAVSNNDHYSDFIEYATKCEIANNVEKQLICIGRGEYLRHHYTQKGCYGFGVRSIASFVNGNWEGKSLKKNPIDVYGIMDIVSYLCRRNWLNNKTAAVIYNSIIKRYGLLKYEKMIYCCAQFGGLGMDRPYHYYVNKPLVIDIREKDYTTKYSSRVMIDNILNFYEKEVLYPDMEINKDKILKDRYLQDIIKSEISSGGDLVVKSEPTEYTLFQHEQVNVTFSTIEAWIKNSHYKENPYRMLKGFIKFKDGSDAWKIFCERKGFEIDEVACDRQGDFISEPMILNLIKEYKQIRNLVNKHINLVRTEFDIIS